MTRISTSKLGIKVPEVKKVKEGTQNIDNLKQNKYTSDFILSDAWPFYVLYARFILSDA